MGLKQAACTICHKAFDGLTSNTFFHGKCGRLFHAECCFITKGCGICPVMDVKDVDKVNFDLVDIEDPLVEQLQQNRTVMEKEIEEKDRIIEEKNRTIEEKNRTIEIALAENEALKQTIRDREMADGRGRTEIPVIEISLLRWHLSAENAVDTNGRAKQEEDIIDVESGDEGGVNPVEQVKGRRDDGGAKEATDGEVASSDDGGGEQPLEVRQFRIVLHRVDQNGGTAPKQHDAPNAQQGAARNRAPVGRRAGKRRAAARTKEAIRGGTRRLQAGRAGQPDRRAEAVAKVPCSMHCGRLFVNRHNMQNHVRLIHRNERNFLRCGECKQLCSTAHLLKLHMGVHSVARSHVCTVCKKRFKSPADLKTHQVVHAVECLFKCGVCPKAFKSFPLLMMHRDRTHPRERPFRCDGCKKGFAKQYLLREHERRFCGV